ncbi:MAG: ABC transporter ATP-binding protein [Acidiferrobacteraceae bacterium]|nr:ABC transporter ATP-binding protein [Acidiferrobacteraceae bacterium]|tara:strand:- start:43118 stop:45052 length:1935 start_codon:yes stop_codon:yes gene_type:complete
MKYLIRFDNVSLSFGTYPILKNAEFSIEAGERVCLVGHNGAGKTSMLRLLNNEIEPDSGEIRRPNNIVLSHLKQHLPIRKNMTVQDYVEEGLSLIRSLRDKYRECSEKLNIPQNLAQSEILYSIIDAHGGWNIEQQIAKVCAELGLDPSEGIDNLSGGWRRRAALARSLVCNPDVLLLDEPTNHLDLGSIEWLEDKIHKIPGAVLFITHDRKFLQKLATRIVQIDRGQITSWPGNYQKYLVKRKKSLSEEASKNKEFDRKLADEESWYRQGTKARRARNEGRVRALMEMRKKKEERIPLAHDVKIHIEEAAPSGKRVIETHKICYRVGERTLIHDLTLRIMRGDRVGLVGNNGVGKSTLLNILLEKIAPDHGFVKTGVNIQLGYFDQHREELDVKKTVFEIVGDGKDYITSNGKSRHVIGYLRGFLFSPKRSMTPVGALSGGERNRLLLARLFTKPTNLLVLDEPTNDLDIETLEVLEQQISDYDGTLIVVSHDRQFLDNVVNRIFVFESNGQIRPYIGNYSDWLERGIDLDQRDASKKISKTSNDFNRSSIKHKKKMKLSYKLQRELDKLPIVIDILENEIAILQDQIMTPAFYEQSYTDTKPILDKALEKQTALDQALDRWTELEELQHSLAVSQDQTGNSS